MKRLNVYLVILFVDHYYVDQITLLWHRAVNDEGRHLFCLVNADKLPYHISEEVLNNLEVITQGSKGTKLFNILRDHTF